MKISALPPALLLLAAPACTQVEEVQPPLVSQQNIVEVRQAALGMSAVTYNAMKGRIDSNADVKPVTFAARRLEKWANVLPTMFPPGTSSPGARPAIWENFADFQAKAAAYAAASRRLAEAAEANDKAAFAAHWAAVGESCKACHDLYRVEQKR